MNDVKSKYCFYCERPFGKLPDGKLRIRTRDHIIPKKEGGKNVVKNYCYCCLKCNQMKGHRMPEMFASDLRYMISDRQSHSRNNRNQKGLEIMLKNVERLILEIGPYRHTLQKTAEPPKKYASVVKDRIKDEGITEQRPATPLWWRGLNEK